MSKGEIKFSMVLIAADTPARFSNADNATKGLESNGQTEIVPLLVKLYIQSFYLRGRDHL